MAGAFFAVLAFFAGAFFAGVAAGVLVGVVGVSLIDASPQNRAWLNPDPAGGVKRCHSCTVRRVPLPPLPEEMERRNDASPWAFAGMIGLAAVFFLIAATPTVVDAPWWVVALLLVAWVVALVQACRWFVRRPVAVPVLSVLLGLGWFAVVMAGARWLDWA